MAMTPGKAQRLKYQVEDARTLIDLERRRSDLESERANLQEKRANLEQQRANAEENRADRTEARRQQIINKLLAILDDDTRDAAAKIAIIRERINDEQR